MNILITGGVGYIGSHVVKQLSSKKNVNITIIDNLCGGEFDSIGVLRNLFPKNNFDFINLDLANFNILENIFEYKKFDAVLHFAAYLQVGESVQKPIKYYRNNTMNTTSLIYLCDKYKVNKFIFSSTAAVYGEPTKVPIDENTLLAPINPYGMSKLMSEQVLKDTAKANQNFKYVILRYFNVAGASIDNSLGECHNPETHLIPLIVQTALGKRDSIKMFGDDYPTSDGSCIRDYVHVEDLASAHIEALDFLNFGNESDIFNCGYGHGFSVKEVINAVKKITNIDFRVDVVERRDGDPAILVADNTKIKNKMNWVPKYDDLDLICESALKWEMKVLNDNR